VTIEQWRRIVRELADEAGATVEHTRGGHLAIRHPDGWVVFCAGSPSEGYRAKKNVRSQIRRAQRGRAP
jgi:hypothetical protein